MVRQTDGWMDRQVKRLAYRNMDEWTDRQTLGRNTWVPR